ncbi:MAG: hypothetical protein H0X12_06670 [Nocardioides sp.]|nr:hypothetical protein [Nocardioides sp.]
MGSLGLFFTSVLNALLIAVIARRLLGVPVGWPRTIVLAIMVNASATPLITWSGERLDFAPGPDGSMPVSGVLIVILAVAWLVALEVGVHAILEARVPTGTLPGPLTLVRSLPCSRWCWRSSPRPRPSAGSRWCSPTAGRRVVVVAFRSTWHDPHPLPDRRPT